MAAWLAYNLNEKLVEALVACGFNSPTEIQEKSLVYATHSVDLIVASKTGSGKTLTYLVPILNSICNAIDKGTFDDLQMSLILLPTRELAIQVETVLKKVIDHLRASYPDTKIRTCTIAGGFSEEKQLRVLSSHPKVVVGTVGRIWDLLQNAKSEDLKAIASSNFLILDEIDRIIDLGQMKELQQVLRYIENPKGFKFTSGELEEAEMHQVDFDEAVTNQMQFVEDYDEEFDKQFLSGSKTAGVNHQTNKTRKTYVISATLGKAFFTSRMMTKKVKSDLKKIMKNNPETVPNMKLKEIMKYITFKNKTKIIDMTTDVLLPETLEVMKVDVLKEDKMLYLYYFANLYKDKPMIIFTNSISSSNRIKSLLSLGNLNCTSLHSKMQQNHRIKKLDSFREGKVNILICTDVASRGLDIPEVEVVINVHCPKDIDTLVHRSGRTARMGKSGKSIIIADGEDRKRLTKYKKDFGFDKMKNITVPLSNLEPLKPVIDRMKVLEKADFKEASQSRDLKWKHKTAEEIGVDASEEEPEEEGAAAKKKLEIKSKKENIRQNLSNKNVQQYSQGRKNVYLSLEEIKKISEQLNELKKEKASEIRDQSRTRDKPVDDKPLKYIVKPARDPTKKRMKARYSNGNNFITGPFGIAERNLGKRKPSIKQKSGSKKKYKRK